MSSSVVFGFVGVGTLTSALVTGLCTLDRSKSRLPQFRIVLSPRNQARAAQLQQKFPNLVTVAESNQEVLDSSDFVFLAVLNAQAYNVISSLNFSATSKSVLISMVGGLSVPKICEFLGQKSPSNILPREQICCAIPLPPVAEHKGVTLMHPVPAKGSPIETVGVVFEELGTCVEVALPEQMDKLPVIACLMGTYYQILKSSCDWLEENGVDRRTAAKYVGCVMESIAHDGAQAGKRETGECSPSQFQRLINEQTPGGFNEQGIRILKEQGVFDNLKNALTVINARWEGKQLPNTSQTNNKDNSGANCNTNGKKAAKKTSGCPFHNPNVLLGLGLFVGVIVFNAVRKRRV